MNKQSGIYKITNILNNHCYIGSTINITKRFSTHKYKLNNNKHHSIYLQNAWNKYNATSFTFEVLLYCDITNLIFYEQRAIDTYKPEYNICLIAGTPLGRLCSDETKKKISISKAGKKQTQEAIDKRRCSNIGKKRTEETKLKISISHTGKKMSEESIKKRLDTIKTLNKPVSEETKLKISNSNKGRKLSKENLEKMLEARRIKGAHKQSQETRLKISQSLKERKKKEKEA
jgi:group I intron endonuclease